MQADFSIELGHDDPVLEFPWPPEAGLRYYDLKHSPELITRMEEAQRFPELAEFLLTINSPASIFETAKCDAWSSTEMSPEEDVFAAAMKFGSYVDLLFAPDGPRFSLPDHESLARRVVALLKRVPEVPAAAEFLIRRCFYQGTEGPGFYLTIYVYGYGDDEVQARLQWAIGLKLVENALRQK